VNWRNICRLLTEKQKNEGDRNEEMKNEAEKNRKKIQKEDK
jgi:hypothetical protein